MMVNDGYPVSDLRKGTNVVMNFREFRMSAIWLSATSPSASEQRAMVSLTSCRDPSAGELSFLFQKVIQGDRRRFWE